MFHSGNFHVLLDACVLYPAALRDTLLSLAEKELYQPKWSHQILEEWRSNLQANRPDIPIQVLHRTIDVMNAAFPDAVIENYEALIPAVILPDENNRHVLAAAIKANVDVIDTYNIRDFPAELVTRFGIEIITPDNFILHIIDLDPEIALDALYVQIARLVNPPQAIEDLLQTLEQNSLNRSVKRLRDIIKQRI